MGRGIGKNRNLRKCFLYLNVFPVLGKYPVLWVFMGGKTYLHDKSQKPDIHFLRGMWLLSANHHNQPLGSIKSQQSKDGRDTVDTNLTTSAEVTTVSHHSSQASEVRDNVRSLHSWWTVPWHDFGSGSGYPTSYYSKSFFKSSTQICWPHDILWIYFFGWLIQPKRISDACNREL